MRRRVGHVDAAGEHRDRRRAGGQRAAVGRGVDAVGAAGHDGPAAVAEPGRELGGDVRRRTTSRRASPTSATARRSHVAPRCAAPRTHRARRRAVAQVGQRPRPLVVARDRRRPPQPARAARSRSASQGRQPARSAARCSVVARPWLAGSRSTTSTGAHPGDRRAPSSASSGSPDRVSAAAPSRSSARRRSCRRCRRTGRPPRSSASRTSPAPAGRARRDRPASRRPAAPGRPPRRSAGRSSSAASSAPRWPRRGQRPAPPQHRVTGHLGVDAATASRRAGSPVALPGGGDPTGDDRGRLGACRSASSSARVAAAARPAGRSGRAAARTAGRGSAAGPSACRCSLAAAGAVAASRTGTGWRRAPAGTGPGRPHPAASPGDRDLARLQRLAQRVERRPGELRRLVEEQHAAVRQRRLAWPGDARAAADDRGHRGGVVRRLRNGGRRHQRAAPRPAPRRPSGWRSPRATPSSSSGGSSPGSRSASMVLPAPGGPSRNRWWPPAAATSSARRPSRLADDVDQVGR